MAAVRGPDERLMSQVGDAITRATRVAQTEGFAQPGEEIVVAAGEPFGHSGTTNVLRVATVR